MTSPSPPQSLPELLDRSAALYGTRPAYTEVAAGKRRAVTWQEVAALSRQAAAGFVGLGLQRGDRVAICAQNRIDWLIGCYGALRAGAICTLVYFDLAPGEIRRQVEWSGSRFLLASDDVLEKLEERLPKVERLIRLGEAGQPGEVLSLASLLQAKAETLPEPPAPDDTALIVYTSGTTGGARGVMLSHRNLIANAQAAQEAFGFSEDDSTLLVLPLHHALPFLACAVLVPLVGAFAVIENDLRRVRERLQEFRPTIFFGVPALFEIVYRNILARAEAEGRLGKLRKALAVARLVKRLTGLNLGPWLFRPVHQALGGRLRFLVSGGAALNPETARQFFNLGLPLLQGWGMTEASPAIAVQRFSRRRFLTSRHYERQAGSVGPPLPGIEVRLADVPEKDVVVARDGEGEVIIRGPNVFQGYWQAPDETAHVLKDGWLHTGDMGRIDSEGNVYLTGRSKYIIVLDSGEKVYPDEIEAKLQESDLLADVCVVGRRQREKTVVTLVVYPMPEAAAARLAGTPPDEQALRRLVEEDVATLCRELAAYKRVVRIELSDQPLPKTPLRKVARGLIAGEYEFSLERWQASAETATA